MSRDRRWNKWLSRRAFLGGGAATLALPFLPSLLPRVARAGSAETPPVRLLFYYVPNGIHMAAWTPDSEGAGYDLKAITSPLAPIQSEVSLFTGLNNAAGHLSGVPGDHARGTGAFLTCMQPKLTDGDDIENGISVDQVAAQHNGAETLFPSLQLGVQGGTSTGNCDSGYSCAYARNISWSGPTTPLPKSTNPQLIFDRLFQGFDVDLSEEERARRRMYRTSVLDQVLGDAETLHGKLSARDRLKVDEYLTGVRELEQRIEDLATESVCEPGDRPAVTSSYTYPQHVDVLHDLMVKAMECDLTRYLSFMLGNGGSQRQYTFLGVEGGHHDISHHQGSQDNYDRLTTIGTWEVEQWAALLERMRAVEEADGTTLLDNSLVLFSSEIADGNSHSHFLLPVLLGGRGAGAHSPGRHIAYPGERSIADLYLTMLQAAGVPATEFGSDSEGILEEVE